MKSQILIFLGALVIGLFTGIIPISIGAGSAFTSINTVMAPLVCSGDEIVPAWEYHPKGRPALASGPDLETRWICVNQTTHEAHIAGYRTIFIAGVVYGLLFTVLLYFLGRRLIDTEANE